MRGSTDICQLPSGPDPPIDSQWLISPGLMSGCSQGQDTQSKAENNSESSSGYRRIYVVLGDGAT